MNDAEELGSHIINAKVQKAHNNCINLTILYAVSLRYTSYKMASYAERYIFGDTMRILILTFCLLSSLSVTASPITYICTYNSYSNEEGNHKVKKDFILTFIVDEKGKNAYILGNQGSEKVANFTHPMGGVAFVEVTATTNIMSTAIDSNGNSVHSRNTSLGGELIPSQYYGKCIIK